MGFHTNKARRAYFNYLQQMLSETELGAALQTLPPDTAGVLRLHYLKGHSFLEITMIMQRSISVIRNHHNRGIYLLACYFNHNPRNWNSLGV